MRRGFSMVEAVVVLVVAGILTGLAFPRVAPLLDRLAVERAVGGVWSFYQAARFSALTHGASVRVELRPDSLVAVYELTVRDSVFLRRGGPALDGVELTGTKLTTRLHANGLGAGAANLTLTFRRGSYQEKLTLSRLGRMKRWR